MIARICRSEPLPRALNALALLVVGTGLAGCADMSDSMTSAFADPAKYDLYECKQLEPERKTLATRAAEFAGARAYRGCQAADRNSLQDSERKPSAVGERSGK